MSLTNCLQKLERPLAEFDTDGIKRDAAEYRSRGHSLREAEMQAVVDHVDALRHEHERIAGLVLDRYYEEHPEKRPAPQSAQPSPAIPRAIEQQLDAEIEAASEDTVTAAAGRAAKAARKAMEEAKGASDYEGIANALERAADELQKRWPESAEAFDEVAKMMRERVPKEEPGSFAKAPGVPKETAPDAARDEHRWQETMETDRGPAFVGRNVALFPIKKFPHGVVGYRILIDGEGAGELVGRVEDGRFTDVYWIDATKKGRGTGTAAMRAIIANTDGPVHIRTVLDSAKPFWDKLGTHDYDENADGRLSWEAHARAADVSRLGPEKSGRAAAETSGRPAEEVRRGDGISPERARAYLEERVGKEAIQGLIDSGRFKLRTSEAKDLPEEVRKALADGEAVFGYYEPSSKTSYLLADHLTDAGHSAGGLEDAHAIFMHEVGVHYGLREVLGDEALNDISSRVLAAAEHGKRTPLARAARAAKAHAERSGAPKEKLGEETVAWLVADRATHRLAPVQRIIAKVRAWLVKKGFTVAISPDAIAELARGAARRVAADGIVISATHETGRFARERRPFAEAVRDVLHGRYDLGYRVDIGETPKVLRAIGAPDLRLSVTARAIEKVHYDHGLTERELASLPERLAEPVMVFDSDTNPGTHLVVTDMVKRGSPVVVAVHPGRNVGNVDVNLLASAYPKGRMPLDRWYRDGLLRYIDKQKSPVLADIVRLQSPWIQKGQGLAKNIVTDRDLVKGSFAKRKDNEPDWVKQEDPLTQEALRKAGVWKPHESLADRVREWAKDWQHHVLQGLVDQFDPIKNYDYRSYMLARMSKSADSALEALLNYGTLKMDKDGALDVNFESGGFLKIMSELNGEHDRFLAWVIGNRAERLLSEGREHNFSPGDIWRLKNLNTGRMKGGEKRSALYAKARADLDRYNKSVLDIAERAGLIDADSRGAWERDFYVPFYRDMEDEGVGGPVKSRGMTGQYAFKMLKGGAQSLGDPLNNVLKNWAHLLDASLKNEAARESLRAAERLGGAHKVPSGEKDAVFVLDKRTETIPKGQTYVEDGQTKVSDGTAKVVTHGKVYYAVDDPFLLDALRSIGFTGFQGRGMKAMSTMKRLLTLGVTVSPTFRIRNLIRDSLTSIGTTKTSYNVFRNIVEGWKGTKEGSPEFGSVLAGGGIMRYGTYLEGDRAIHVKRLIEAGVKEDTILNTPEKAKAAFQKGIDWWQHVGDRSENINRVALYKKLREEGKSHLEASYEARDLMDFSMQGTWASIRFLTQTVPFMNARIQGLYKIGRAAKEDATRFSIVMTATALASMGLMLAYKDDEDWKQREDWDRETYWWFKIGKTAYRIPKPFEIGALGTIAERGLEAMVTEELNGKQFAERVWSILMNQLSLNPVPQLFKPLMEVWANKDTFTDRPIETPSMENLSKSERAGPHTSEVAKLAGKAGVLSPAQIDHLIRGYFGWLGTTATMGADAALGEITNAPEKPTRRLDQEFIVGDFARELPELQSRYVTLFYENAKEAAEAMGDLRHYQQLRAKEKAIAYYRENKDELRLAGMYSKVQRQMSKINAAIRTTQMGKGTADEKRQRLDHLYAMRNRLAKLSELKRRRVAKSP